MKKLFLFLVILHLIVSISSAQLSVKDTLLLAFSNEIFWGASSELEMNDYAGFGKYGPINLGDSNPATCWAEGSKSNGVGEYIWITISKDTRSLRIRNGYQKNETVYFANNRPKGIDLELFACYEPSGYVTESHNGFFISKPLGFSSTVLKDTMAYQDVQLIFNWTEINSQMANNDIFDEDRLTLKFKISSIYQGKKWNDACISDINIVLPSYFDITPDEHGLLQVSANKRDTLFYNSEYVYQIIEISPDLRWIIFILMPSDIENSRVETIYKLYNTEKESFITSHNLVTIYGFIEKYGKLYVEGLTNNFKDKSILLKNL